VSVEVGSTSAPVPTMMSEVVRSVGAAPVGAEIVGASPAFAVTVGRFVADDTLEPPVDVMTTIATIISAITPVSEKAIVFFGGFMCEIYLRSGGGLDFSHDFNCEN
jgi:hypothetical protein